MIEDSKILNSFLHCLALTGKVFLFITRIGLIAQQVLRIFGHVFQITEVMHVGIETGATIEIGTNANCHHHNDSGYQFSLAINGVVVNMVYQQKGFLVNLISLGVQ